MAKVDIFSGFLGAGKTTLIRKLISEAYEDESWRKDGEKYHYADMMIFDAYDLSKEKNMRAENFEKNIFIKWHGGHSGELLKDDIARALIGKLKEANKDSKRWEDTNLDGPRDFPLII